VEDMRAVSKGASYTLNTIEIDGGISLVSHFSVSESFGFLLAQGLLHSNHGIVFVDNTAVLESDFRGGGGVQDTVPMVRAWPNHLRAQIRKPSRVGKELLSENPKHFTFAPFGNFYHFLIEALPKLLLVRQKFPHVLILLPRTSPKFVKHLLGELGLRCLELTGGSWNVSSLVIMERTPYTPATTGEVELLRSLVSDSGAGSTPRTRLYVSRVGSGRQLRSEVALEEFLKTQGFDILRLDDLGSVLRNAQLFDKAELVIGPHGAGLANIAFCSPGTVVLEIATKNFWLPLFSALAEAAKLTHYVLFLDTKSTEDSGDGNDAIDQIREFLKGSKSRVFQT
jgi:hypothetical protein